MAIEITIRDGDPWWMSPDIWVVPGNDPEGPSGVPIVGAPAFLWARVWNNGSNSVQDATVRFYWADPSTGFDRNTAHLVGTSFVSLGAGEVAETLCLQPWIPEFVNDGHECVLAEAFHVPGDPLPSTPEFNVPTDRHVAQRNLSVVLAAANGFFRFTFNVFNVTRLDRVYRMTLEPGDERQLKPMIPTLGQEFAGVTLNGKLSKGAIVEERCAAEDAAGESAALKGGLDLPISAHRKVNRTLVGKVEGGPALFHLKQWEGNRVVGGISLLVLPRNAKQEG
jgi:hypothetical protein